MDQDPPCGFNVVVFVCQMGRGNAPQTTPNRLGKRFAWIARP